jgi:hypothetical protein
MLTIRIDDIRRGTLPVSSGNEGWIGVSPDGGEYHLVVPVDTQIARGVMACNQPTDGTPFGGYVGWLYFRCAPYEAGTDEHACQEEQVRRNADALVEWLADQGIACGLANGQATATGLQRPETSDSLPAATPVATCPECGRAWQRVGDLLRDPTIRIEGYRASPEDFDRGQFVFSHGCTEKVVVSVRRFARPAFRGRSLIGTHACPGLCYYESSLLPCLARCEGARYRRILGRLRSRNNKRQAVTEGCGQERGPVGSE